MIIAITGVTGLRNRGVEALLDPLLAGLCEVFPGASFRVFSGSPDYDVSRLKSTNIQVLSEGSFAPLSTSRKRRIAEKLKFVPPRPPLYCWEGFSKIDLLVVTGGDVFSSEYGDWSFERHLVPMRIALQQGTPFVIFAQSIGPFTRDHHKASWMEVASNATLISVRERRTYDYLTGDLGFDDDQVRLVADPAFLLHPDQSSKQWLRSSSGATSDVVAISLSQGICQWTGVSRDLWLATWADLIHRMTTQWGVNVVLVPHVQEPYANDVVACTDVWRLMGFPKEVTVLGAELSASEYKGIISGCSMVIAERMHAGIAGLSSGVCTAIVAYSVKARGVIADLLGRRLADDGALLEGTLFSSPDTIWPKIDYLWNDRANVAARIAEQLPRAVALANHGFSILPKLVR